MPATAAAGGNGRPGPATRPQQAATTVARTTAGTPDRSPAATAPTRPGPDFSLYFFGDYPQERIEDRYTALLAAATHADTHGLHAVWLPERHFDSFGGIFPNPSVLAAAIAVRTSRVRIHAGCAVLPLHDPIRVAEEWSVVDNLSAGRVGIGCASGWHARDFALAPQVYGRHREAMYESVEQIRTLWRGGTLTRTAGNGQPVDLRLFPRPVQQTPPMFTAVVGNPDSYRRAAAADLGIITNLMAQDPDRLADNIALYRATRAEHGLDPAAGRVVLLLHTYLGDDTDRVREEAFGPFCDYLRSSLALFGQVTNSLGVTIDLENTPPEDVDFLLRRAYQRYTADRALIGSPDDCRAIVERFVASGVDEIGCFVDFGLPPDRMLAGLPGIDRLREAVRGGGTARPATPAEPTPDGTIPGEPLTEAQREIWFVERMLPGRPTYTESKVVQLDGPLDVEALRGAVELVVHRHPALRSVFRETAGEPRRVILPCGPVDLPVHDVTGDVDEVAAAAVREETDHRFDLAAGPLFAARLIRLDGQRHLLVLRMHHLVIDTLSAQILSREIAAAYRAAVTGGTVELPPPPPAAPAPATTDAGADPRHLDYWTSQLQPLPSRLELPVDRPRPPAPSGAGGVAGVALDTDLTTRVRAFARQHRATPFMVLLAGFAAVLSEVGNQRDVVLGTPVAHRPAGTENTVGLYINTLPLRIEVTEESGFADLVRTVRSVLIDAQEHQDVPVQRIIRALDLQPQPGRHPLFDVVIEFDNGAVFELDLPGVTATLLNHGVARAPFDLTLFLTNRSDTIDCQLHFATDLFDPATARQILDRLALALRAGTTDPDRALTRLPRLTGDEQALIAAWQDGGAPAEGADQPLAASLALKETAVVDRYGRTDGPDLDRRADAVAAALRAVGVGPGHLVAVHLPRGVDAVAAMVGVLRTGAGYVPLDPGQPTARSAAIVGQAGATAVVSASTVTALDVPVPTIQADRLAPTSDTSVPAADVALHDVAYVLFTSGSTGQAKGCVIEHRAIANAVAWFVRDLGITADDRLSWFCSPGFDASCLEVWPALRTGATLCVVPDEVRVDPARLRDWLVDTAVTVALLPTPVGELLIDLDWSTGPRPALRHLVLGGDRLRRGARADLPFQVTNVYGPTEATVVSTWAHLSPDDGDVPPIGRPVPGTWLRVLDRHGRPVPVGVPGELHLGGVQIGRGYLDDADRTAQRFLPDTEIATGTGTGDGRVFRTGDVVRWRPDGQLEFLHRNDAQVQIRGFRVEPGEAEHHLRQLDGVRDAAVRAWRDEHDEAYLAAYVVPAHEGVDADVLLRALHEHLPAHLVPTVCTLMSALPQLPSGKLDRAALPEPDHATRAGHGTMVPPATPLEQRLHDIWRAELGGDTISTEATFFQLGGTSLSALRLLHRVADELGETIEVFEFLQQPTIRAMARLLADATADPTADATADPTADATADPTAGGAVDGSQPRVRGTL
ncbi:non-ribosomal peptide synthetase [Micromonospora echinofusca]|uniref:Amino acid adenylation domain-containing protein n=1 Tax=Micromonospora echinofusca TaxID=47858 RepID=A0ABS3VV39_MICEH|nr:non-ribosomal peptide synthetase [Micromonospora echinofusca]MBO4208417.1 amino acid adenylation domain-containing protein [Micromonospora echinofusca]